MVSMYSRCLVFFFLCSLVVQVSSQLCHGVPQYGRCSSNSACGCFIMEGASDIGICGFQWVVCSDLTPCDETDSFCHQPDHICVRHPRCHERPLCYPASMIDSKVCPPMKTSNGTSTAVMSTTTQKPEFLPLRGSAVDISPNAQWQQDAITVADGYLQPDGTNATDKLYFPMGLFVYDEATIYVTEPNKHRVMEFKSGKTSGKVVAGGDERGNEPHQLSGPSDVIVDKETDSLIICDNNNKRIVRWPRVNGVVGETIISNINCHGLTMDENGSLYVTAYDTDELIRYRRGESQGTIIAGGKGRGGRLDQVAWPQCVFVDRDFTVYVSEWNNHRVTKWVEGAKEGIVVAGGQGQGSASNQMAGPEGVVVDRSGNVYIADCFNHRIVRWVKGATQGTIIAGGNGTGKQPNQLSCPFGLSFDPRGNLLVVDHWNHRVQKFNLI